MDYVQGAVSKWNFITSKCSLVHLNAFWSIRNVYFFERFSTHSVINEFHCWRFQKDVIAYDSCYFCRHIIYIVIRMCQISLICRVMFAPSNSTHKYETCEKYMERENSKIALFFLLSPKYFKQRHLKIAHYRNQHAFLIAQDNFNVFCITTRASITISFEHWKRLECMAFDSVISDHHTEVLHDQMIAYMCMYLTIYFTFKSSLWYSWILFVIDCCLFYWLVRQRFISVKWQHSDQTHLFITLSPVDLSQNTILSQVVYHSKRQLVLDSLR